MASPESSMPLLEPPDIAGALQAVDLDGRASRHFSYRDLCACGETWRESQVENIPLQSATFTSIRGLCAEVLDPIVDAFGSLQLTYGFSGPALARLIRSGIAPRLDQHAGHELNRAGKPICARLGQAVDLHIPLQSSLMVARFIVAHTPFDRLYVYGADRPLHVSWGPQQSRQISVMALHNGRRMPRVMPQAQFDRWVSGA